MAHGRRQRSPAESEVAVVELEVINIDHGEG